MNETWWYDEGNEYLNKNHEGKQYSEGNQDSDKWFEKKESWWISGIRVQLPSGQVWTWLPWLPSRSDMVRGSDHQTMLSPTDSYRESALNGPIHLIHLLMGCSIPFLHVKIFQPKFTAGVFSRENLWSRNKARFWPFGDVSNCNTGLRIHWFPITISHF